MFTGIISNLGKLNKKEVSKFSFSAPASFCKKLKKGISVSINGTCLTVINKAGNTFSVEIMPETLNRTILENIKIDDLVNLELPATPNTYLSGHIVQGHVDTVSKLLDIQKDGNSRILKFSILQKFAKYIVPKGIIIINGIALTVISIKPNYFTTGIIPYTWENTMLRTIQKNDLVNIEVDILAKYVEKLLK